MQDALVDIDVSEIDKLNTEAWQLNRKDAHKAIEIANIALGRLATITITL